MKAVALSREMVPNGANACFECLVGFDDGKYLTTQIVTEYSVFVFRCLRIGMSIVVDVKCLLKVYSFPLIPQKDRTLPELLIMF